MATPKTGTLVFSLETLCVLLGLGGDSFVIHGSNVRRNSESVPKQH